MRESKKKPSKPTADTTSVLIVYDEVSEGTHLYRVDVTARQLEILKKVNGAYINSDDCTDEQFDLMTRKVLPALDKRAAGDEDINSRWLGIWESAKLKLEDMPRIPACQVFIVGFLP